MSQPVRKTLGMLVGMAVLGTVFVLGSQSFSPYQATGSPTATTTLAAPGALPANGFTEVAKAVTPAVVNITTVGWRNSSADRMVRSDPLDRNFEVRKAHKVHRSPVDFTAAGRARGSSCPRTATFSPITMSSMALVK